jgi:Leucine-rich repeat (LRR) protein
MVIFMVVKGEAEVEWRSRVTTPNRLEAGKVTCLRLLTVWLRSQRRRRTIMEQEPGDEYIRRTAAFIRSHERNLAAAGLSGRRRTRKPSPDEPPASVLNPMAWFGPATTPAPAAKPLVLSLDTHRLFYILVRLEGIGIDIGTLDVKVDSPSRPMSFVNIFAGPDRSDALSLSSIRSSFSAVSALSLGGSFWSSSPPVSVGTELKYIYSSFTKLPALSLSAPGRKMIKELAAEPPNENALPLDAFKNLQSLECADIDPRMLLGWDRLAESLRSLTIKRSGVEDVSDVFIGAVVDDQARREGCSTRAPRGRVSRNGARKGSFHSTRLPDSVPEDESAETPDPKPAEGEERQQSPVPTPLSSLKWAFLRHLSLSDNALTFLPATPLQHLTSVTHLDLSSNLLVSVPACLSTLYNLISLNLSDNMIDSVLGIYTQLGQILTLNLSRNRLESICGLERLLALERVDLRSNHIDESAEIGRLATLPHIAEVWVEGNPFVEYEESYRITCFDYFLKEGHNVTLDGTFPGFYERRKLTAPSPQLMPAAHQAATSPLPPVVAVTSPQSPASSTPQVWSTAPAADEAKKISPTPSGNASPLLVGKPRRKKNKRIVDLDADHSDSTVSGPSHAQSRSDDSAFPDRELSPDTRSVSGTVPDASPDAPSPSVPTMPKTPVYTKVMRTPGRSRHSRYQTEFTPTMSTSSSPPISSSPLRPIPSQLSQTPPLPTISRAPTSPVPGGRALQGSATFSPRSAARRARVSASAYEAPPAASGEGAGGPAEYRKRIEALRSDMGEGWLKVYSQSQFGTGAAAA